MKCPVHNTVFHSPEINNKIKLIGLMVVCMKHISFDTLIALSVELCACSVVYDFLVDLR